MSKVLLILLAAISVASASFERPWENRTWIITNPHILSYGVELWWDVPELHKTLESINIDSMLRVPANGSSAQQIQKTKESLAAAENLKGLCIARLLWTAEGVVFNPTLVFINLFSNTSECTQYSGKWKSSVDWSLSAVESGFAEADLAIQGARASYASLEFSGICKGVYAGPGSEPCPELNSAFDSVEKNISEGDYGKYVAAKELSFELTSKLRSSIPDLSGTDTLLGLLWNEHGVIPSFLRLSEKSKEAKKLAEDEFQLQIDSAVLKKSQSDKLVSELSKQKLFLIERATSGHELTVGSISHRFSGFQKKASYLAAQISESRLEFSKTTQRNYLANALLNITSATEDYDTLSDDLTQLQTDAEATASDQKSETEAEIQKTTDFVSGQTPSPASISYLEQAKDEYDKAKYSDTLGERFALYSKAAALARTGRSINLENQISSAASISDLKDLISRAEKDQINVATEKESLSIISKIPIDFSEEKSKELISSVKSKAKIKYEDALTNKRNALLDKIALAGPDAADLASELARYESGLIDKGGILFPEAIGSLAKLSSDYDTLDKTLDGYMQRIVGTAMSASATTLIPEAKLDSPSEVLVDLVLTNSRQYASKNAEVKVSLDRPLQLMLSDISSGKEAVQNVRVTEGGRILLITFSEIGPYETKRITFKRNMTIARTMTDTISAEGNGDGSATVNRKIEFELDTDVGSLAIPEELEIPLIDGSVPTKLVAGKHTILSEYRLDDAYSETTSNIRAYSFGTNSQVEFEVKIIPEIDLVKVPVYLSSLNSSNIVSMDIVSVTGEQVKNERRLSQTQYGAEVLNLKKGKSASIRVTYMVENSKDFIEQQLGILSALNLSENTRSLLQQAESHYDSGNYSKAIVLIENTKKLLEAEEKNSQNALEEFSEQSNLIRSEISAIDTAISGTTLNAAFVQKLSSRRAELQTVLEEANNSDISKIENVDKNWLNKELTSLKKDLYKQYNDLKERFFQSGNSSTPSEFLDFEQKLSTFESGNRIESAIASLEAIENVKKVVEVEEKSAKAEKETRRSIFEKSKSDLLDSWDEYSKQMSAAKGTEYSSLFTESERKITATITEAEESLDKDPRLFRQKLEDINMTKKRLEDALGSLKQQAFSRISTLQTIIGKSGRDDLSAKLETLSSMAEGGDYVTVLRSAASLSKELESQEKPDDNLMIIGVTALAILAGAGFYLMQKPKKELRKLNDWRFHQSGSEFAKPPAKSITEKTTEANRS
jgi:hypothetical protein